jgi:KaiC/GvpD/RAD55 family RecA-like ATPase
MGWKDGEKHPVFLEQWKEATVKGKEQLQEHFGKYVDAGIAIVTGRESNLTVVDFDTKDNELMMMLYNACPTYCVQTKKGFHFYYRYIPDFETGADRFGKSVDVRNEGGLIFCPPTKNYEPFGDYDIETINEEALALLKSKYTSSKDKKIDLRTTTTRNDDLFRKACGWIDHYTPKEVWSKMVKANKEFLKGELTEGELETIYQQVLKYKKTGQLPEEAEKYRLVTLDTIQDNVEKEQRYPLGFRALDEVLMDEDFIGTKTQGGMKMGEMLALTGRPGNGKTLLACQITASMQAHGIKSMWFSYEVNLRSLKKIFTRLGARTDMVMSVAMDDTVQMKGNVDWIEIYIKQALSFGVKLIVIDNLDFIELRQDKNSNYSMNQQAFLGAVVTQIYNLAVQYQIMVILIAHVRKPQQQGLKVKRPSLFDVAGTSQVERLCSIGIIVDREENEDGTFSNYSKIYLDKNRPSGRRVQTTVEYKNGKLLDTTGQIEQYAKDIFNT